MTFHGLKEGSRFLIEVTFKVALESVQFLN